MQTANGPPKDLRYIAPGDFVIEFGEFSTIPGMKVWGMMVGLWQYVICFDERNPGYGYIPSKKGPLVKSMQFFGGPLDGRGYPRWQDAAKIICDHVQRTALDI